jgi:hypothetical protein
MKRWWMLGLLAIVGCSSAPAADTGDEADVQARPPPTKDDSPLEQEPASGPPASTEPEIIDADAGAPKADAATPDAATEIPCAAGATVYAFSNGDRWMYSRTDVTPSGWSRRGAVFRLAKEGALEATHELHLLYSAQADDYLVTSIKNEGASLGYVWKTTLGRAYTHKDAGSTRLHRFVKPNPSLRHYVTTDVSTGPASFSIESEGAPTGFVCPR